MIGGDREHFTPLFCRDHIWNGLSDWLPTRLDEYIEYSCFLPSFLIGRKDVWCWRIDCRECSAQTEYFLSFVGSSVPCLVQRFGLLVCGEEIFCLFLYVIFIVLDGFHWWSTWFADQRPLTARMIGYESVRGAGWSMALGRCWPLSICREFTPMI